MDIQALLARGGVRIDLDRPRCLFFDKAATWHLAQQYGPDFLQKIYTVRPLEGGAKKDGTQLALNDIDALQFALWAGLQYEARARGEELTLDRCGDFFVPAKISPIFYRVVLALSRGIETPPLEGKVPAAAASPAGAAESEPGPARVSTMQRRKGSRSPSSGKHRSNSGRNR